MYKGKTILCVIPARIGSKGLKEKNIKIFNGRPLLHFAIEASLEVGIIDKVLLSTDSKKISDTCKEFTNLEVLFRSAEYSNDKATSHSVLCHALKSEESKKLKYDIVIIVQATNPLVKPDDIINTLKLHVDSNSDTCYSITRIENFSYSKFFKMDESNTLERFISDSSVNKPRQEYSSAFIRNGSCYSFLTKNLSSDSFFEGRVVGYEVPKERYSDIDDELDFKIAEFLYRQYME